MADETGDFAGRVALVAGGGSGIGRATVERLGRGGAAVVFCGNDEPMVRRTEAELRDEGLTVTGRVADVASAADVRQVVDATVAEHGGLDVLVNSAGIQRYGTVEETSEELWDEVLTVNLKAMYLT